MFPRLQSVHAGRANYVRVKAIAGCLKRVLESRLHAFVFSPSDKTLLAHMKSHQQWGYYISPHTVPESPKL